MSPDPTPFPPDSHVVDASEWEVLDPDWLRSPLASPTDPFTPATLVSPPLTHLADSLPDEGFADPLPTTYRSRHTPPIPEPPTTSSYSGHVAVSLTDLARTRFFAATSPARLPPLTAPAPVNPASGLIYLLAHSLRFVPDPEPMLAGMTPFELPLSFIVRAGITTGTTSICTLHLSDQSTLRLTYPSGHAFVRALRALGVPVARFDSPPPTPPSFTGPPSAVIELDAIEDQ